MSKRRLLFITTGGTIASVRTAQGLRPVLTSEELLAHLPELNDLCSPETLAQDCAGRSPRYYIFRRG